MIVIMIIQLTLHRGFLDSNRLHQVLRLLILPTKLRLFIFTTIVHDITFLTMFILMGVECQTTTREVCFALLLMCTQLTLQSALQSTPK